MHVVPWVLKQEQGMSQAECAYMCACLDALSKYCLETTLSLIYDEVFLALKAIILMKSSIGSLILYLTPVHYASYQSE